MSIALAWDERYSSAISTHYESVEIQGEWQMEHKEMSKVIPYGLSE
jgi:hypothetical protein